MTAAQISLVCSDRYTTLAIWAPRSHMGNPWIILLLPLWYWTTYHSLFPWPEHIRRDGSLPNCLLTTLEGILQLVCLSSFGIAHMEFQDPFLSHTIMQPTTHVQTIAQVSLEPVTRSWPSWIAIPGYTCSLGALAIMEVLTYHTSNFDIAVNIVGTKIGDSGWAIPESFPLHAKERRIASITPCKCGSK